MNYNQEELLTLVAQLRILARLPASAPGTFERMDGLTKSIQQNSSVPAIAAHALDVQFKAEDVFRRAHLMPETVLREMLADRLHRLEATIRASTASIPLIPIERRGSHRVGRRATDRLVIT